MYSSLIIHNNNVPHSSDFRNTIKFNLTSSGLDRYISDDIINQIKNKDFDIIFIKDSLSSNYLEFYGLLLAYHIRLSPELDGKRFVPIVILSDLDGYLLNKITTMAKILFTKNIFIGKNSKETIKYYGALSLSSMTEEEYRKYFLNLIDIEAPKDYLSHHGISNEWSVYRWSNFLNIKDSQAIDENNNKISSMLYFKYLVEKYPIPRVKGIKFIPRAPKSVGKILYIDDQWKNGWQDIFNNYFANTNNISLTTVKETYTDKTKKQILEFAQNSIKNTNPDLIILDLRLHNDDHGNDIREEELSGIKLLKYIKEEINRGIQVIILSASGKSLILNEANKYKIVGYIKKEHPEDLTVNTKNNFEQLKILIDTGLEKKYLKEIWIIQNSILDLSIFDNEQYGQIKIEVESVFDTLDSNIYNKFVYAMLSIYKVLETIIKFYIVEKRDYQQNYAYWINSDKKIDFIEKDMNYPKITAENSFNNSVENKIRIILHQKLGLTDKTLHDIIHNIVHIRNNTIHPNSNTASFTIDNNNILEWFDMLFTILKSIDAQEYKKEL